MFIDSLDHINIKTSNLKKMVVFYHEILGLELGYRPSFNFEGAWLYSLWLCGRCAQVSVAQPPAQVA